MSKSTEGHAHAVLLTDSEKNIHRTLRRAVTDSGREIEFSDDPERAGVNNLLTIYQALTGRDRDEVTSDFAGARGYGDLKIRVAEVVAEALRPIRTRYEELISNPLELDRLLARGASAAREVAEPKAELVKRRVGLVPST